MAGSSICGKLYTALMVTKLSDDGLVKNILDVGVGMGTYYDLLSPHLTDLDWAGVEVWEPYIEEFSLKSKYPTLINMDVRKIAFEKEPKRDLTMFGDILEHMTKKEAQIVINNSFQKSRAILISIPVVHYPQDEVNGNPYEKHIKDDWSHEEVMQSFPNIVCSLIHNYIGVYFLSDDAEIIQAIKASEEEICSIVTEQLPNDYLKWE